MYCVLGTTSRNADHHLDRMSNSLLGKYFISRLVLVLEVNTNRIWKTTTFRTTVGLVAETASYHPSLIRTLGRQVATRYV